MEGNRMKNLAPDILAILAMLLITIVLITCIANDLNGGIIYTGLAVISGLGGYTVGRVVTKK